MTRHRMIAAGFMALGLIAVLPVAAQEPSHALSPADAAAELRAARKQFSPELEKIKALAGRWEGTTFRESQGTRPAVITYEVTAAGSAVVEKLFAGTAGEMMTVYHDDINGRLVAAHYCSAANQPRLSLKEADGERMYFVLSPDREIKADLENHAHELTLRIGADGSLVHDWLNHYLGKPADERNFKLTRVK
jgi:hypothetical protein